MDKGLLRLAYGGLAMTEQFFSQGWSLALWTFLPGGSGILPDQNRQDVCSTIFCSAICGALRFSRTLEPFNPWILSYSSLRGVQLDAPSRQVESSSTPTQL